MALTVTVADDPDALASLLDWLRREPGLRGVRITRLDPVPAPGQMGALADTVALAGQAAPLVAAVATPLGVWLGTRVRRTRVRVKDGDREVEIDTGALKDPVAIAQEILRQIGDGGPPPGAR